MVASTYAASMSMPEAIMQCAALALATGGHGPDLFLVCAGRAGATDDRAGRLDGVARQRRLKIGSEERHESWG